jgi:tRNA 2-thiocytidine biosynthesis protein TtcA
VYVRERQTRAFANAMGLPLIGDNCPACFRMPTQRMHMKQLLSTEEAYNKLLFRRILSTIRPLMGEKNG